MKNARITLLFSVLPVLYQLDYRERVGVDLNVPGLAGFSVTKSFEVRSRPNPVAVGSGHATPTKNRPGRPLTTSKNSLAH